MSSPTLTAHPTLSAPPRTLRDWFTILRELSKSGIVALVLISVLGGYLAGHPFEQPLDWTRMLSTLLGVLLLASGSSALNQLQERHIDAEMPRTSRRPLPSGRMTPGFVLGFVLLATTTGLALLAMLSVPVCLLGLAALISYNGLYTLWWKRHWAYAAIPGAIPGALPILMGYASASGKTFAPAGIYLFLVLFYWQMPHFWVLALRFKDDYSRGSIPTLPVALGTSVTVNQIVLWCLGYVGLALLAPLFLQIRAVYLTAAVAISIKLLWELRGFARRPESQSWLRFFLWVNFSLILYIAAADADLWSVYLLPYLR